MEHKTIIQNWRTFIKESAQREQSVLEEGPLSSALVGASIALSTLGMPNPTTPLQTSPSAQIVKTAQDTSNSLKKLLEPDAMPDEVLLSMIQDLDTAANFVQMGDFEDRATDEEMRPILDAIKKAKAALKPAVDHMGRLKYDYSKEAMKQWREKRKKDPKLKMPRMPIPENVLPALQGVYEEIFALLNKQDARGDKTAKHFLKYAKNADHAIAQRQPLSSMIYGPTAKKDPAWNLGYGKGFERKF